MVKNVISVENLSKSYTLGQIGTGTFSHDMAVWWARVRGKPNPLLRIGETDHGNRVGEELWALRDVSFQVEQGEVLGIIGRNGAGKSTLLKILSRVTAPTSGVVKVKGRIASLLEVGTGFHPELTGRENIFLNGAILGMTKQEVTRKFDEIVDFSGVEKFIDTPVKRYSSGMYVRLAFAVAAHLESEILLVDEVLAVGDAEFQKKCLGKMGDVASKEGRTVFFVSHVMGSIDALCNSVCLFEKGLLLNKGITKEIINSYLNSNSAVGIIKLQNPFISWKGVISKDYLISDDIYLDWTLITGNYHFENVVINIAITNVAGEKIIRIQSDTLIKTLDWDRNCEHYIHYEINKPHLAPGQYYLEIYITDKDKTIFWVQNISVFTISPQVVYQHNRTYYDRIGYILPKFNIECKSQNIK